MPAVAPNATWVTARMRRFGNRSASTPAMGENSRIGRNCKPGRDAERTGAAGEREHQPVLGDALHPRTDVRHQRAGGEQPVVAQPQRGERRPHGNLIG